MKYHRFMQAGLVGGIFCFGLPPSASGCEPIVPLARIFAGPNYFALSLLWLVVAVTVKCVLFAGMEKSLRWYHAALFLLLANVFSTIPGAFVAAFAANPVAIFIGLPVIYVFSLPPAGRLLAYARQDGKPVKVSRWLLALVSPLVIFVTWVLFFVAQAFLDKNQYVAYWPVKYAFVSVALMLSIALTSLWEEWGVAALARRRYASKSYLVTVVRANYVTFGIILLAAALQILPKRLHSPGFLAG